MCVWEVIGGVGGLCVAEVVEGRWGGRLERKTERGNQGRDEEGVQNRRGEKRGLGCVKRVLVGGNVGCDKAQLVWWVCWLGCERRGGQY